MLYLYIDVQDHYTLLEQKNLLNATKNSSVNKAKFISMYFMFLESYNLLWIRSFTPIKSNIYIYINNIILKLYKDRIWNMLVRI
jgi:hypothetical protein